MILTFILKSQVKTFVNKIVNQKKEKKRKRKFKQDLFSFFKESYSYTRQIIDGIMKK